MPAGRHAFELFTPLNLSLLPALRRYAAIEALAQHRHNLQCTKVVHGSSGSGDEPLGTLSHRTHDLLIRDGSGNGRQGATAGEASGTRAITTTPPADAVPRTFGWTRVAALTAGTCGRHPLVPHHANPRVRTTSVMNGTVGAGTRRGEAEAGAGAGAGAGVETGKGATASAPGVAAAAQGQRKTHAAVIDGGSGPSRKLSVDLILRSAQDLAASTADVMLRSLERWVGLEVDAASAPQARVAAAVSTGSRSDIGATPSTSYASAGACAGAGAGAGASASAGAGVRRRPGRYFDRSSRINPAVFHREPRAAAVRKQLGAVTEGEDASETDSDSEDDSNDSSDEDVDGLGSGAGESSRLGFKTSSENAYFETLVRLNYALHPERVGDLVSLIDQRCPPSCVLFPPLHQCRGGCPLDSATLAKQGTLPMVVMYCLLDALSPDWLFEWRDTSFVCVCVCVCVSACFLPVVATIWGGVCVFATGTRPERTVGGV